MNQRSGADDTDALLRRADWRFLTAMPAPERSVVSGGDPLLDCVRAVSQRTDEIRTAACAAADLAVVANPTLSSMREAWRALRPGGFVYTEWTSTGHTGAVARRVLERAGFEDITTYVTRCEAGRALAWIPAGSSRALHWYLRGADARQSVRARIARGVRIAAWRGSDLFPIAAPLCGVARKHGSDANDFLAVRSRALRSAGNSGGPAQRRSPTAWLLLTPGESSLNKVVLLALDGRGTPVCVVKAARTAAAAAGLRREASALHEVRAATGALPGIPRVLESGECGASTFVVQTAIDGLPVSRLVRRNADAIALRAAEWQSRLVQRTGPASQARRTARVAAVLAYAARYFGATDLEPVRVTRAALSFVDSLPIASEQRDFSPWNVFSTASGDLAVLDWESADAFGWPALDLIYFSHYVCAYRADARTREQLLDVHSATLASGRPEATAVSRWLGAYAALTGVPQRAIAALRVLCWLIHSHAECERLTLQHGSPPSADDMRKSLFAAMWRQEAHAAASMAA